MPELSLSMKPVFVRTVQDLSDL